MGLTGMMGINVIEQNKISKVLDRYSGKDEADEFYKLIDALKKDNPDACQFLDEEKAAFDERILMESFHLKPCPFCGTTPTTKNLTGSDYSIVCECGASSPIRDTRMEALEAWNERTTPRAVSRLKKILAESEGLSWDDFLRFEYGVNPIPKDRITPIISDWFKFKECIEAL